MDPITLILYPPCSTCQKAKAFLQDQGLVFAERHIKENRPTAEELRLWSRESGLPLRRYFNTSGLLYRSMNLAERLPELGEEEQLELIASDGMLVRRPLLIVGNRALPGFRPAEWTALLRETAHLS